MMIYVFSFFIRFWNSAVSVRCVWISYLLCGSWYSFWKSILFCCGKSLQLISSITVAHFILTVSNRLNTRVRSSLSTLHYHSFLFFFLISTTFIIFQHKNCILSLISMTIFSQCCKSDLSPIMHTVSSCFLHVANSYEVTVLLY